MPRKRTPLIELRKRLGLSREQVAASLCVAITTVKWWELGYGCPSDENEAKLRNFYREIAVAKGYKLQQWIDLEILYFKFGPEAANYKHYTEKEKSWQKPRRRRRRRRQTR
jgi:transcriptional regulator with XRE-family HTH domain